MPNPGRGWYQIFHFFIPQKPDFAELFWSLRSDETLAMAVVNIGAYQSRPLDQVALQTVEDILNFFAREEKDLILRFVYDSEGQGLLHEPQLFAQIEEHILQLSPIIRAHTKTIFVLQGFFVGSWGEMHSSKFLSSVYLKRLHQLVEAAAGEHTWLAVRKPAQWRILHMPDARGVRMGLFNDGIFGSQTHLGTFGYKKRLQSQWEEAWCPEDELIFEEQLCRKVPHGGEVVSAQQMNSRGEPNVIQELRRMHISYLNCVHDAKLLDAWKQKHSPWSGTSLYDYVGAQLGYRFCVRKVDVLVEKSQRRIEIVVENTGFAPCYEACNVTLEIVTDGEVVSQEAPWDLRLLMPGQKVIWQCALPNGQGKLYLSAKRKKDDRQVCFAHKALENGKLFLGHLK